ncbi:MAG: phosphate ABC transporter permease subunit PstC [Verrucomicrobiae bacterium]|nr:phosphate ABC transporter permease subunit PstC [Verrucomicrobiae bacterium]
MDPEERARKLKMAEEVVMEAPDYDALAKPFYDQVAEHGKLAAQVRAAVVTAYEALPKPDDPAIRTPPGREKLRAAAADYAHLMETLTRVEKTLPKWRHDKPVSRTRGVLMFFAGRDWVTNSSWHDFYGLLPLLTGSFLISVLALVVAVPFSVASAIYVNQLAGRREQNLIKPAIEFIQAIPSIVLGFFGILVLGSFLREWSQGQLHVSPHGFVGSLPVIREIFTGICGFLNWVAQYVPGFPMSERLTMLNAGLLLAFMTVPTIFTLAEDALNNVPHSFTEASFALGASKLQTILRVVVPSSLSGIVAAVLLGFGRIIGETMVVLLVAGNKIQIPDFRAGLGVFAQPAHSMTGIIAQELGEVDQGSIHWRALFLVGMVLFTISLVTNFIAQRILAKYHVKA